MAIPTHPVWLSETKRFWTSKRSDGLTAIDDALEAYWKSSTLPRLIALKQAVDAFVAAKGLKDSGQVDSKRDSKGAVTALKQAVDAQVGQGQVPLAPMTPVLALQALSPVAHVSRGATFHTMDDDDQLTEFAQRVKRDVFPNWNAATPNQRAVLMHGALTEIHNNCGVPPTLCEAANLGPNTNGLFQFSDWKLQLNETMFNHPIVLANVHPYFVWVAEIVYHEGRHAEQWYHMARYHALGKSQSEAESVIWHTLGIHSMPVCTAAAQNPMKGQDPMLGKTKAWNASVYETGFRAITLKKLSLRANTNPLLNMDNFHAVAHGAYKGELAEEVDAWGIQDLLRPKF